MGIHIGFSEIENSTISRYFLPPPALNTKYTLLMYSDELLQMNCENPPTSIGQLN